MQRIWVWLAAAWLVVGAGAAEAGSIPDALRAMARGDFSKAISQLGGQTGTEAKVLRARAYFLAKQYRQAEALYRQVIKQEAAGSALGRKARFGLAECHASGHRFKQAEALFSRVLDELTAKERREKIAKRYILLGDENLDPPDEQRVADPGRAQRFFQAALELGIEGKLAEATQLKVGQCLRRQKNFPQAARHFEALVQAKEPFLRAAEAVFWAGRSWLDVRSGAAARRNLRKLAALYPRSSLVPEADFLLSRSYGMPKPANGVELLRGSQALRNYIQHHPKGKMVEQARLEIALAPSLLKRRAEAEDELRAYIKAGGPEDNLAQARFELGACLAGQTRYADAVKAWQSYLQHHPAHGKWLQARQGIEDMIFKEAEAAEQKENWVQAAQLFARYAEVYPASSRTAHALLRGGRALAEQEKPAAALKRYRFLTGKFPDSPWAGEAWLAIGILLEERRADFQAARKAYQKASKGKKDKAARLALVRIAALDAPSLTVEAPANFRAGQDPFITWHVRNLESVKIRLFRIEAEDFFRNRYRMGEVTDLDIALCAPDRDWNVPVAGYQKFQRIKQKVPLAIKRPGLYLLDLAAGDLQATTAVLVTDLGVMVKATPGDVFVFAQDLPRLRSARDAQVIVAADNGVLLEGQTGADGVYRAKLPEDVGSEDLQVFASWQGHLAWTGMGYPGGQPATAVAGRAFLFSDRPVYRPGDEVFLAGIVRDRPSKMGFLGFKSGQKAKLTILGPSGRQQKQSQVELDEFGTFHLSYRLDAAARQGNYSFRLDSSRQTFQGHFRVLQFRRRPFDLSVRFDKPVVFQGEALEGVIRIRRQQGSPAAKIPLEYRLAGEAAWQAAVTDAAGQVRFSYSTHGYEESRKVALQIRLRRHNQIHEASALIAVEGFEIRLAVEDKTLFAGQAFDLHLQVQGPDQLPRGAQIELQVLRNGAGAPAELRVLQKSLRIPDSGSLRFPLRLEQEGRHVIRVLGLDRAQHPISAEMVVLVVGDKEPGIFLDLDRSVQTLATPAQVKIHSRMKQALVLLTYETDRILGYRTVKVKKGETNIRLPLDESLVPNFVLAAAAMDGSQLHTAARSIVVARQLDLTVRADQKSYAPGDEVTLTLIAKDADGRPVDARLMVAVVDETLLRQFPENLPNLAETFLLRHPTGQVTTLASNTFSFPEVKAWYVERAEVHEAEGSAVMAALRADRERMTEAAASQFDQMSGLGVTGGSLGGGGYGNAIGVGGLGMRGHGRGGGGSAVHSGVASSMGGASFLRQFFAETAVFAPAVRTGPDGVAQVIFRLPDSITTWRVTTRAVTRDTQLGEVRTQLRATRAFWAQLNLPPELEVGDQISPQVQVFNEGSVARKVQLKLMSGQGSKAQIRSVPVAAHASAKVAFAPIMVPGLADGAGLEFTLSAEAGPLSDRQKRTIPVRPRGVDEKIQVSGELRTKARRSLQMPAGLRQAQLNIQFDSRMTRLFLANQMDPLAFGDRPEQALLAMNLLDLLSATADPVMRDRVEKRLYSALVRLMNVQHADGGWGFARAYTQSDLVLTAAAIRALARARPLAGKIGWFFPQADFDRALGWLDKGLTGLDAEDWQRRAEVLYALAHVGKQRVPFVHLHRLHRLRANLSLGAGALLGHTWLLLGRKEKAAEVVASHRAKIQVGLVAGKTDAWLRPWGTQISDLARMLSLLAAVEPGDPLVKQGADWLLQQAAASAWQFPRAAEAISGALAGLLSAPQRNERFRVRVFLNDQAVGQVQSAGGKDIAALKVDPSLLKTGENRLELRLEGSGTCYFLATLSGIRPSGDARAVAPPVRLRRTVEALPGPYQGHEIKPGFSVVLPGSKKWINKVKRIAAGRRLRVRLEFTQDSKVGLDQCIIRDRIPAGFELVAGSVRNGALHQTGSGRELGFFVSANNWRKTVQYDLQALHAGSFQFPPAQVISLADPGRRALGGEMEFVVEDSSSPAPDRRVTPDELYQVGKLALALDPELAQSKLEALSTEYQLREAIAIEVLGKLLFAAIDLDDHQRIVKYFELTKEKNPSLVIPFAKVRPVQQAYRALHLYEGGLHLSRGLAQARFLAEIRAVGILETEDEMAEALALLYELIHTFPDNNLGAEATYAFSQVVFSKADAVRRGEKVPGFDRPGLLGEVVALMARFLGVYPKDPQGPTAIYSLASALLERGQTKESVRWCAAGLEQYQESDLADAIAYLKAFAHFKLGEFGPSLDICKDIDRNAEDEASREMAQYIMAQIHHARGAMDQALRYYEMVSDRFRDAAETVEEAKQVILSAPDLMEVPRGERPVLTLTTRNLDTADLRVYRVDPMKLYLLKGSLTDLDQVNLAGVKPILTRSLRFAHQPGVTIEEKINLRLPTTGAFLVLVRCPSRSATTLVLVNRLQTEVSEDIEEGRARVTIRDHRGRPVPKARVQLKGSDDDRFTAGQTDLRGIFIADEINGAITVIAQYQKAYGIYRSTESLDDEEAIDEKSSPRRSKNSEYDFDAREIDNQLMPAQNAAEPNKTFFQQNVKGMSVQQAM